MSKTKSKISSGAKDIEELCCEDILEGDGICEDGQVIQGKVVASWSFNEDNHSSLPEVK